MSEQPEETQKEEEPFGLGCALELFSEVSEVFEMIDNLKNIINAQKSIVERAQEKFLYILSQYHEQPHLLDSHIEQMLEKLILIIRDPQNDMKLKHETFKYMFIIVNVRGYKTIVRHLPHEVADFEPVLQMLESQTPTDPETWATRYVLLLWLSIIVMIPFHMSRLDGFSTDENKKTVMCRVLDVCKTYTIVTDKCRDAAAFLASKFLTRCDVKERYLSSFFDWATELSVSKDSTVFVKYGTLASIAMILKHGKREDLLPYARQLLQWVINAEFKNYSGANVQKLVYKIVQRIGLTFLPPRVAAWRYQRGNRSLAANLSAGDSTSHSTVELTSPKVVIEEDIVEDIEVPDEIEEIIDQLIQGLGSDDGVVRWSAAKGIGRVTGRLPKELADEVVGSVLLLFSPRESDSSWHGGCLALAELGRRGLLLPHRLPEVVPVVLKALLYDEPRGYASVGSHIRDAACYVCWSFARAYETHILKPFVNDIAGTLLIVTCFDKEINCRRAASAAFQENVGRQGSFPHGIEILTTADFYTVSMRNNAYLNISVFVAQFDEYVLPLIDHLVQRKVDHWDLAIRELCAKALHNLTPKAPDHMISVILPALFDKTKSIDLNTRHGSVLAVGEILFALSIVAKNDEKQIEDLIGTDLIISSKSLIPYFRDRLYFRGMGGELMKQACSHFIEKCSMARMPFHNDSIVEDWLFLLNECLSYEVPLIRTAAINALPSVLNEYYHDKIDEQMQLIATYKNCLHSVYNQVDRMGHALALGSLPKFMLQGHTSVVVEALISSTEINQTTLKWAESRRDAVKALTSICLTMSDNIGTDLTDDHIRMIYNTFLNGLTEYTQDNRGDIGAWVREASMSGLQSLTLLLAKQKPDLLDSSLVKKIMAGIAQQAVEKIDRTRALAGKIFYNLIYNDPIVPNIPNHDSLKSIFSKEECEMFNWNSAAVTFPKFVQLIEFPDYTYHVLLGLVSSVGGMTETLVKSSSASLFAYLKTEEEKKGVTEIKRLCDTIFNIFVDYQNIDRVTVSMFKFLDKVMSSGCIHLVINDPKSIFPQKTLKLIQSEINGCKDIYKLIDGINVLCQFVQIKSDVARTALVQLGILLCHRQSYIRRSTSARLYESLLVYGDNSVIPIDNLDEIMNLLSTTDWEQSIDVIKPIRNNLCNLMNVRVPVPKKNV